MDIPELLGVLEWVGCAGWVDPEEEEEAGRVSAPRPIARLRFRGVAAGRLLHKMGLCSKPQTSPCVSSRLNSAVQWGSLLTYSRVFGVSNKDLDLF